MPDHNLTYAHEDELTFLNRSGSLREKLVAAHTAVKKELPFIARIAIALYDAKTGVLKTYMHSSGKDDPLGHYQALIDEAPSLQEILKRNQPRVINNMLTFEDSDKEHIKRLGRQGYGASYTIPLFNNGEFFGFMFFNSYQKDVFNEHTLSMLDLHGHLISLMVINELNAIQTLSAALTTSSHITHQRDPETGSHMDRMSRYSRLIARELIGKYKLDDTYIEHVFMFAPLHDIGKIAIPDHILLKRGPLTEDEKQIMRTHAEKGKDIIDDLLKNFGLENINHADVLRNIAAAHHEAMNGKGYPSGLKGEEIPLEARIIAVADVFDALTSQRPYKHAWSNDEAFEALQELAGEQLDRDCVAALLVHRNEINEIQRLFKEKTV